MSVFAVLAFLIYVVYGETILSDNLGNVIGLPLAGGNATGAITNTNSRVSTSPYFLSVYVNNGKQGGQGHVVEGTQESFFFLPPNNAPRYGDATLIRSGFSDNFMDNNVVWNTSSGQYLGSPVDPMTTVGLYMFMFTIPSASHILVNLTYINSGAPQIVVDSISILVTNPSTGLGDPQFLGLRGQVFQVHGIAGAVYNILSDVNTQVNSRFVFLTDGECPIIDGKTEANCWSHAGSYMGELSFQQTVDNQLHQLLLIAGPALTGFSGIVLNGASMTVNDTFEHGQFSVTVRSSHIVSVTVDNFAFELSNSDNFLNQALMNTRPLSLLTSHGLLGQTHAAKIYPNEVRYIEGEIDDYVISDNNIFGNDFVFNKFML